MMKTLRLACCLAAGALVLGSASAAPVSASGKASVEAPSELSQWRGWIEQSRSDRACADQSAQECVWLGAMSLVESGAGIWTASFDATNLSSEKVKIRLPGDDSKWPADAMAGTQTLAIGRDAEGPYVMMPERSSSRIVARIDVSRAASSSLAIPRDFAIASVKPLSGPMRWIDPAQGVDLAAKEIPASKAVATATEMNVRISRLVSDGQVPLMTTRIKIENGGERRPLTLEGIIPEGSLPVQMQAPGAKLEGSTLVAEAKVGTSILTIVSRLDPNLGIKWLKPTSKTAAVDPREFIFVKSNESARKISAEGRAVDPKALDPMLSFGALPAYELSAESSLTLTPKPLEKLSEEPKAASMTEAWLDFSGREVFALQRLQFEKSQQGWYEPVGGWRATQATVGQNPAIVAKSDAGEAGKIATYKGMGELTVGLSSSPGLVVDIPAIATDGIMATNAKATLHIPLGWRALAVYGSGHSDSGWLASLSLWDWFLIILTVWAGRSLLGWRAAGSLLGAMAFGRLFLGAPFGIFLPLLGFLALSKYLPKGGFRVAAFSLFALMFAALAMETAPFTMSRIQKTMHGVLEDRAQPGSGYSASGATVGMYGATGDTIWGESGRSGGATVGGIATNVGSQSNTGIEADREMAEADKDASTLNGPVAAPVPMPAAAPMMKMESVPMEAPGSVAMDVATGISSLSKSKERDRNAVAQGRAQVSVAGAQAGKGLPVWTSGIAVNVGFSSPSNASSVAKVLLMPPWLVKLCGLLTLAFLWHVIVVAGREAWIAYGKNGDGKPSSADGSSGSVPASSVSGEKA